VINHEITYDTVMKKHLRPRCPPFQRQGGNVPTLPRPCITQTLFGQLLQGPAFF